MRGLHKPCCIILLLGLSFSCSARVHEEAAGVDWQSRPLINHPLVGHIWAVAAGRFVPPSRVYERLRSAHFVLLGEVHSNPDHHRLQQRVIEHLVAQGRRPAVVFEMFERAHQPEIERLRDAYPNAADHIARETHMEDRGWPWRLYRPLVETALAHDLPLFGADLSRPTVREIISAGLEKTLGQERVEALALDMPLAPDVVAAMRDDIVAAHCGHAPKEVVNGMIAAQRARDASLADGLLANAGGDGAVLIAGSGHARNDSAVPLYLRRRAPGKSVISVAFTEVAASKEDPEDYLPAILGSQQAVDYLWFTPSHPAGDPCEGLEERLRTLHGKVPPE
jgi:uncharacterized iron-regulated protein